MAGLGGQHEGTRRGSLTRWSKTDACIDLDALEDLREQLRKTNILDDDIDDILLEETERDETQRSSDTRVGDLEELSGASIAGPPDRSGFLVKKSGAFSGHRKRFFLLRAGTLAWYKEEQESVPLGAERLNGCKITPMSKGNGFLLTTALKEYELQAETAEDCQAWVVAMQEHALVEPDDDGEVIDVKHANRRGNEKKVKSKDTKGSSMMSDLALRAEKKIAGKAITSDLGKKMLKEYCVDETFVLLEGLRDLANRQASKDESLPKKTGLKLENTILRLAVKVALLFQHGRLKPHDFREAITKIDRLCLEVVRKYNATREGKSDTQDPKHLGMVSRVFNLEVELSGLLEGQISPKNIEALKMVTGFFSDSKRIGAIVADPDVDGPITVIVGALRAMYHLD